MNSIPEMIIVSGLPGGGKSTYAKMWLSEDPDHRTRINYDDLRIMLFGNGWKFNRADEEKMKGVARQMATEAINAGKSVIIDNTNLNEKVRDAWANLAKSLGATVSQVEMDTPIEECIRRDALREVRVGRGVIERMALFYGFIDWNDYDGKFIIVDIDGTVADITHRVGFVRPICIDCQLFAVKGKCPNEKCESKAISKKNWKAFFSNVKADKPIKPIVDMIDNLARYYNILFVTGRDTSIAKDTEDWLNKHFSEDYQGESMPYYTHLFMRNSGDSRPDYEIKAEILELLPKARIAFVLEDRQQVVDMYRKEGLTVLQCGEGQF